MRIHEVPDDVRPAALARLNRELAEIDYRRELRSLIELGYSKHQVMRWIGITEKFLDDSLHAAGRDLALLEGFSGGTPDEICKRYAVGQIDRAQLIDELARYPYTEPGDTDGYDWLAVVPPGTWSEVSDAEWYGFIDDDVYGEVFDLRHGSGE